MSAPSVLLVCLGNICRSPTAEAAVREAAARAGVEVSVSSAGTGSWHVGAPADERMQRAARQAGLDLEGVAQRVDAAMIERADLVLAMDSSNLDDLREIASRAGVTTPIRRFREFDPDADDNDMDVPDPYQGGEPGFVEVVEICRRAAAEVVAFLCDGPHTAGATVT